MTTWQLILASLRFHWRINLAVALGVAVGTAVLTGALFVGDSVRGSLTEMTLRRLGPVDSAMVTDRFFRTALAEEVSAGLAFQESGAIALPAILLPGTVEQPDSGRRANGVQILGLDSATMARFKSDEPSATAADEDAELVRLNPALADELGVKPGEEVILRLPRPADVPADSALGRKTETTLSLRLTVGPLMTVEELGNFALRPDQQLPLNAFVPLSALQRVLEQPDKANALLVLSKQPDTTSEAATARQQSSLQPRLEDYGLALTANERGYFNLSSERMMLEPAVIEAAESAFENVQPAFTYLANGIRVGDREIPYSTITAIDFTGDDTAHQAIGPFRGVNGEVLPPLGADEIALSTWAAEDLQAKPGDQVTLTFFEPESTHGEVKERTATLRLAAIVDLVGAAADPMLTPTLPGVTDQLSIADWNPPFPFNAQRIRTIDEDYWDAHRATPKAFVALATGQKLWASRFGDNTSLRVPAAEGRGVETLRQSLKIDPAAVGFVLQPLKAQGLAAARGTTPFSLLFLGFSMFIIAAAMMLVALLFRLGMENRAREVGVLLAVGYQARSVRRMWLLEGLLIAGAGAAVGVLLGLGYATLMIAALRHPEWWMSAVSTPFLEMHPTIASGVIGYLAGLLVSLGAIAVSLRLIRRASVRRLLAGGTQEELQTEYRTPRISRWIAFAAVFISIALGVWATRLDGEAQAGAFFGAGSLVLTAALLLIWSSLRQGGAGALVTSGGGAISRLALRNGARHPGRGTLTMGLVAAASFLIIAISAFRLDPPDARRKDSGAGGFSLVAQSDQPLFANLNTAAGRSELNFSAADSQLLQSATTYSLRVRPGDDASCLNLYQPQQPTVLGATHELVERGGFAWAGTAASSDEERANPWLLLEKPLQGDNPESAPIPVVIDQATAMFSLHLSGVGARYSILDDQGNSVELEVVGLLKNSLLQGVLVIHERDFLKHFPTISGYQYFFVETPVAQTEAVEQVLEKNLSDQGFDAQRTEARLAAFMAVQNTYLSTFQSLGGLGLLLGTFGLAVVQLRNVLERRGELALLRATGFRRSLLARMVMLENAILLVGGLAVGVVAALVAVFPHLISGGAAIPWLSLAITLGTVLIVGLLAGLIAVRAALVAPLLPALRGD